MPDKIKIAVLASGNGTNLKAILSAQQAGNLGKAEVKIVISDRPDAKALDIARNAGIRTVTVEKQHFISREGFDEVLLEEISREKIDLVILAGYMRVLGSRIVEAFSERIMNIHPALLPSFKGSAGILEAFEYGVKITGVTVHFVDKGVDTGPVILQSPVCVEETDTLQSLEEKIHGVEHLLYPRAIRLFTEGKLRVEGRKVRILG